MCYSSATTFFQLLTPILVPSRGETTSIRASKVYHCVTVVTPRTNLLPTLTRPKPTSGQSPSDSGAVTSHRPDTAVLAPPSPYRRRTIPSYPYALSRDTQQSTVPPPVITNTIEASPQSPTTTPTTAHLVERRPTQSRLSPHYPHNITSIITRPFDNYNTITAFRHLSSSPILNSKLPRPIKIHIQSKVPLNFHRGLLSHTVGIHRRPIQTNHNSTRIGYGIHLSVNRRITQDPNILRNLHDDIRIQRSQKHRNNHNRPTRFQLSRRPHLRSITRIVNIIVPPKNQNETKHEIRRRNTPHQRNLRRTRYLRNRRHLTRQEAQRIRLPHRRTLQKGFLTQLRLTQPSRLLGAANSYLNRQALIPSRIHNPFLQRDPPPLLNPRRGYYGTPERVHRC